MTQKGPNARDLRKKRSNSFFLLAHLVAPRQRNHDSISPQHEGTQHLLSEKSSPEWPISRDAGSDAMRVATCAKHRKAMRCDAKFWRCAFSLRKSSAMRPHDAKTLAMRCRDAGHSDPRAHKNKIGTSPPPKPKIPPPPKNEEFYGHGFSCRTDVFFFQASIKLAQPFPAPELRTQILRTQGFFWFLHRCSCFCLTLTGLVFAWVLSDRKCSRCRSNERGRCKTGASQSRRRGPPHPIGSYPSCSCYVLCLWSCELVKSIALFPLFAAPFLFNKTSWRCLPQWDQNFNGSGQMIPGINFFKFAGITAG